MKKLFTYSRSILRSVLFDCPEKVFCVSMQRTGTTSVGKFFRDFGYRWAGWPASEKNDWSLSWHDGDYEKIFSSREFRVANAFEDSPWWHPGFYKILFYRFPRSKFILFTRNPDVWFQSIIKHSKGQILGRGIIHCKIYRRELEYYNLFNSGEIDEDVENHLHERKTLKLAGYAEHYKDIYRLHNKEVQDFFSRHAPEALHVGQIEDSDKWQKLGKFLGVDMPPDYYCHENKSTARVEFPRGLNSNLGKLNID